jgi:hypothetical protein
MPRLVCRFIYVEYRMLASYCEFAIIPVYMPISIQVSACSMLNLICQLQYTCIYMPAHECQISVVRCQVCLYASCSMSTVYAGTWVPSSSLWVAKLAYMSNCYISVDMPSALFQELCTEWYGLYAKIHMLDCDMPNAMTIAMSFRMTTEQVGYFIIYMSITRLWLSILPLQRRNYYYTTRASVYISKSQVFQYAGISWQEQSLVCRHIMARAKF